MGTSLGAGRRVSFWIVATTFGLFLFAAAAPSPLYAVYASRWHFSAIALTEVFAVYAVALLAALLTTGSLSDAIGRKRVILGGLLIQMLSLGLFLAASSVEWLFAARIAQGLATGVATSAMAAALVDLQPADRPTRASLVNSVAPILGLAVGALTSAAIVQYGPNPLRLIYWVILAGFGAVAVAVLFIEEPGLRHGRISLVPRVGVEPAARAAFLALLPSLIAGWAVGGFYLSLGPSLASQLAASSNRLLGGIAIFLIAGIGSLVTLALQSWPSSRSIVVGGTALLIGLALAWAAIAGKSIGLYFVATSVAGIGFGLGWLGVLRTLVALASPAARGALLASIYVVAYLAFAVPAVVAGYGVTRIGLHDAALWYSATVAVLAMAGLGGSVIVRRGRPAAARQLS